MRTFASYLLVTLALIPVRPDRAPPAPPDLERLQGTWEVVVFETPDQKLDAQTLKNYPKLIIQGNTYRWSSGGGGTLKLDPNQRPKAVDFGQSEGPGGIREGIYEVEGDTFRDCISPQGQPRPTQFSTPPGSGYILQVYRRVTK